ncbi:MAG: YcaO-like family protein [Desulfovibrio sp.]|nr:YcaO-like family protein [Desulfovibrio sp.]
MQLSYIYTHTQTVATTGFFACEPDEAFSLSDLCDALEASPLDSFLHTALFRRLRKQPIQELLSLFSQVYTAETDTFCKPALASVLWECAQHESALSDLLAAFPFDAAKRLAQASPMLSLQKAAVSAQAESNHAWWRKLYFENINWLRPLPSPKQAWEHALLSPDAASALQQSLSTSESIATLYERFHARDEEPAEEPTGSDLFRMASDRLLEAGLLAGCEMRHEASLAPVALLREWQLDLQVRQKRLDYRLTGKATAYGRGLSLAQARISCAMEIVERASAYVSLEEKGQETWVSLRKRPLPLCYASFSELVREKRAAVDPALLTQGQNLSEIPLHWVSASDPQGKNVLIPAQAVFLFFNADEVECVTAGSTGLAAGTSLEQAKLNALLEILERDALATVPFLRERCFLAKSRDPRLQSLLDDYAARGIRVQFQDLTHEFALPVFSAFVRAEDGSCVRAQACKLSGFKAALAALTETPWPYSITQPAPFGRATGIGLAGLEERYLEDLPDFSFSNPALALAFVEARLQSLGLTPLYVDMTRADLEFPVVRAVLPGLLSNDDGDSQTDPALRFQARVLGSVG